MRAWVVINAGLIVGLSKDAPIGIVPEDFALAPWLGLLDLVGAIVLLYEWMLRRSAAARYVDSTPQAKNVSSTVRHNLTLC